MSSSFGRFITITSADPKCAAVKFGDLQQALQAEVDLLVGYDYDVVTGTEELEKFQMQRLLCERETDRCYLNLKQKTKAMRPQEIWSIQNYQIFDVCVHIDDCKNYT